MALTKANNRMIDGAPVNVKDFGAVGDGVTDDTAAIQAAIDVLITAGGGTLHIPSGTYYVTSTLDLFKTPFPSGFRLEGESRDQSIISTDQDMAVFEVAEQVEFVNLTIQQTGTAKTGIAIKGAAGKQVAYSTFRNLVLSNFAYGMWFRYTLWNTFDAVRCSGCGIGIRFSRNNNTLSPSNNDNAPGGWNIDPGFFNNQNTLINCVADGGEIGFWGSVHSTAFIGCTAQNQNGDGSSNTYAPSGMPGTGFFLQGRGGTTTAFGAESNSLVSCYVEFTKQPLVFEECRANITGMYIQGNSIGSPYEQPIKATNSVIDVNGLRGTDYFKYQAVLDASTLNGASTGVTTVALSNITNGGVWRIRGNLQTTYSGFSHSGVATTQVASLDTDYTCCKVYVTGIYDGFSPRSAAFTCHRIAGGLSRVQSDNGNSTDITCAFNGGSNIEISTTAGGAYVLRTYVQYISEMSDRVM